MALRLDTDLPLTLTGAPSAPPTALHARSRRMQRRFLALLAVGATSAGTGCGTDRNKDWDWSDFWSGYDYDCTQQSEVSHSERVDEDTDECPTLTAETVVKRRQEVEEYAYGYGYDYENYLDSYYANCGPVESDLDCTTSRASSESAVSCVCTYTVECELIWGCCGYGRPYLDAAGAPVATSATTRPDWSRPPVVALDRLTAAEREQLRDYWLKNAAAEHSLTQRSGGCCRWWSTTSPPMPTSPGRRSPGPSTRAVQRCGARWWRPLRRWRPHPPLLGPIPRRPARTAS